jgi:hypothetical protein
MQYLRLKNSAFQHLEYILEKFSGVIRQSNRDEHKNTKKCFKLFYSAAEKRLAAMPSANNLPVDVK